MSIDPNAEGVEAWEFSTPFVQEETGGERVAFDERTTLEIQLEVQRLDEADDRERGIWMLGLLLLVAFFLLTPGQAGLGLIGIAGAAFGSTAIGLLRVRRRQLRGALGRELAARRREELARASDSALRLAVLRDELDRLEERPRRIAEIVLSAAAGLLFGVMGLVTGTQPAMLAGGAFGVLSLLSWRDDRTRAAEADELRERIRAIEADPRPRTPDEV